MTTRKRHSPEQVVRKLMAADRLLAEGGGQRSGDGSPGAAQHVGGDWDE